jgi:hypothetical protein
MEMCVRIISFQRHMGFDEEMVFMWKFLGNV